MGFDFFRDFCIIEKLEYYRFGKDLNE